MLWLQNTTREKKINNSYISSNRIPQEECSNDGYCLHKENLKRKSSIGNIKEFGLKN